MEDIEKVVFLDVHGDIKKDIDVRLLVADKLEAHHLDFNHLAVSVIMFNFKNEMLLQQRSLQKYHSPGKWSNACCTHPKSGEPPLSAASRRLSEEMGLVCDIIPAFTTEYCLNVGDGLIENEFDHVFIGRTGNAPLIDRKEVAEWRWIPLSTLQPEVRDNPDKYTPWFVLILPELLSHFPGTSSAEE